jgi:hypothetical protein
MKHSKKGSNGPSEGEMEELEVEYTTLEIVSSRKSSKIGSEVLDTEQGIS